MTCAAFSIKFAKTNQKVAENFAICEIIHYYCELFTSLLNEQSMLFTIFPKRQTRRVKLLGTRNSWVVISRCPAGCWAFSFFIFQQAILVFSECTSRAKKEEVQHGLPSVHREEIYTFCQHLQFFVKKFAKFDQFSAVSIPTYATKFYFEAVCQFLRSTK